MEPHIVELGEQPYVGRRETITMTQFARVADHLPTMVTRLGERGVPVSGAPFFRYRVIDMSADLVVEAGIPVATPAMVSAPMFAETLPAGRYVTVSHIGHPDELMQVTARLLDWARDHGLTWDMQPTPTGEVWGCRLEVLRSNPADEPDMHKWRTDLFFKLADRV
ncbi:DNA gyrase inhibitor [Paractinoplanes abujensis]|uniref:Effector-binding domain-containing protein n=1 Tax=Paractinoplanes abujensis TaxID=882441 RepID=A0A7W7D0W6_9ACTN|nr:GyrI-like domain-containing protein [Actinoplanes abujensis]MBB4698295.1 effector-binding domain-containing protein [Actinoplanes abujensis]GID19220.1 DNA gyrase inhibitor [Actinoplanes abujensis]